MRNETGRRNRQKGNAMIEFALVITFLVMLLFGTFSIGMTLTKSVQAGVIARDAGAMFMRYVDFTLTGNQDILVRLANGMQMTLASTVARAVAVRGWLSNTDNSPKKEPASRLARMISSPLAGSTMSTTPSSTI